VKFEIRKTKERVAMEARLQEKEPQHKSLEVALRPATYEQAKKVARGWDVYVLAAEWQQWAQRKNDWPPAKPDAAFLGFCKRRGPHPRY
jgi:hypothetical protein